MDALSRRFRQPLLRYFRKRVGGSQADTEDLVQDVFLRLAGAGSVDPENHVEGYLFTTAANLLRDRQRRHVNRSGSAHEPYEDEIHGAVAQGASSPERLIQGAQLIEQILAALHELPERTRNIFTLYHLHELSHAEISAQMGIAISTIEKHMARASLYLLDRVDPT